MVNAIKSELMKLARPKLMLTIFTILISLELAFTLLLFYKADKTLLAELVKPNGQIYSFRSIAPFIGVLSLCIFASNTAQEYVFGTLKNLLIRQPNRFKLMIGKFLALSIFLLFSSVLTSSVGFLVSLVQAKAHHIDTSSWRIFSSVTISIFSNVYISALVYGLIGMLLAIIFRSSVAAISSGIIWTLAIETLFNFAGKAILKWMPGANLANFGDGGSKELSYLHSTIVIFIYALISAFLILFIFNKRDVVN